MSDAASRASAKREALASSIPEKWRLGKIPPTSELPNVLEYCAAQLSPEERRLTELSCEVLCRMLRAGEVSSRTVTEAFAHRAAIAHQLTNCLTAFMLEPALARADELDQHLAKTGQPVGPLHGLPVSIKDCFFVEGAETSVGFVAWLDGFATRDDEAGLVSVLRKAGAVFYVKTNVPASMMCAETVNNVFGWTCNAHNRAFSAAGSSGGEGTLLSLRGSPLGMGSDIGGSIRLPSSVAGVWGLKSTPGRFTLHGARSALPGQTLVPSVPGPMANSLGALQMFTQLALAAEPWLEDPAVVELPWRPVTLAPKLVLGLMISDGIVEPQPPIRRVMEEVAEALRNEGHEVFEFTPPPHSEALSLWLSIMTQTGGATMHDVVAAGGETLIDEVAEVFGSVKGERTPLAIEEAHELAVSWHEYCAKYERAWNETAQTTQSGRAMDAILLPNTGVVGWKRGGPVYNGFTPVGNVLHFPSVSMPLGTAEAVPATERDDFLTSIDEEVHAAYDPAAAQGMPIGVQVMGRRFQEEKVLAMAQVVEATVAKARASRSTRAVL